ncbi:AhpC/TSA family protein [Trichomonas vaginalis G3]|uniref:AhpC/TSA family protein n=1 Tax=Trichomonas vaginalis (strain ATCC PRA-98 / G3) TaxID=412133 RepID=A2EFN5_TRIV3|nr:peroxiredoxin protein [Trichomonas vaginalis G3]EAY08530.1 AhpC/TSA family protein [Trichomonas vaginalis G3]KAI5542091.1 peroxiredoxin protein [Trichomonas vaginalis G3]|eukprot:XP_001320753.1 AhpC/TSA family protein [Trichomonas vaginalis G3]
MSEQIPLQPGMKAPDFTMQSLGPDMDFHTVKLSDYKGKWLVLFSYPLDFTFVCPTELVELNNNFDKFNKLKCSIIGFSTDSVYVHNAWAMTDRKDGGIGMLKYPLASDLTHAVAEKYGFYLEDECHCLRGTALINPDGIVLHITKNHPDVGRNIQDMLEIIDAAQKLSEKQVNCTSLQTQNAEPLPSKDRELSKVENADKGAKSTCCSLL